MTSFSNNNSDEISKIEKANLLANTSNFSGGNRSYRTKTLHLHIGIPKTASTWLQTKVFTQLQHLCYLDCSQNKMFKNKTDLTKDRQTLGSIFKQSSQVWDGYGDAIFEDLLGDRQEWLADGRDLLISDETIGRQGSRPALLSAHFRKMKLKAVDWGFERINIICLIRRQDHWLASHYAQMTDRNPKAGQADFERLVEEVTSHYLSRYSFGMLLDYYTASLSASCTPAVAAQSSRLDHLERPAGNPPRRHSRSDVYCLLYNKPGLVDQCL